MGKISEIIALFSAYGDDEEDEEIESLQEEDVTPPNPQGKGARDFITNTNSSPPPPKHKKEMEIQQGAGGREDPTLPNSTRELTLLPPPPKHRCSSKLQLKISEYLRLKVEESKHFNDTLRRRKDFKNPYYMHDLITYYNINEIGSCFDKSIFDPHGFDPSDFYDALALKREHQQEGHQKKRKRSRWA